MRTILRSMTLVALMLFGFQTAFANNVVVSNSTVTGQDALNHVAFVQFDITWENSFRDVINHDASWVFVEVLDGRRRHLAACHACCHRAYRTLRF